MSGEGTREELYTFDEMSDGIRDSTTTLGKLFRKLATPTGLRRYRTSTYDMLEPEEKDELEKFVRSLKQDGLTERQKEQILDADIYGNSVGALVGNTTKASVLLDEYERYVRQPAIEKKERAAATTIQKIVRGHHGRKVARKEQAEVARKDAEVAKKDAEMVKAGLFTEREMRAQLREDGSKIRDLFENIANGHGLDADEKKLFLKCANSYNALSERARAEVGGVVVGEKVAASPFYGGTEELDISFSDALKKCMGSTEFKDYAVERLVSSGEELDEGEEVDASSITYEDLGFPEDWMSRYELAACFRTATKEFAVMNKIANARSYGSAALTEGEKEIFVDILVSYEALSDEDKAEVGQMPIGGGYISAYKLGSLVEGYKKTEEFRKFAVKIMTEIGEQRMDTKAERSAEVGDAGKDAKEQADRKQVAAMMAKKLTGSAIGAAMGRVGQSVSGMRGAAVLTALRQAAKHHAASTSVAASTGLRRRTPATASAATSAGAGVGSEVPDARDSGAGAGVGSEVPDARDSGAGAGVGTTVAEGVMSHNLYMAVIDEAVSHYRAVDFEGSSEDLIEKYGDKKMPDSYVNTGNYEEKLKKHLTAPVLVGVDDGKEKAALEERRKAVNKEIHRLVEKDTHELEVQGTEESITFEGAKVTATVNHETGEVVGLKAEVVPGQDPEKHLTLTFPREEDGEIVGYDTVCFEYKGEEGYQIVESTLLNEGKGKLSAGLQSRIHKAVTGEILPSMSTSRSMMQAVAAAGSGLRKAGAGHAASGALPGGAPAIPRAKPPKGRGKLKMD